MATQTVEQSEEETLTQAQNSSDETDGGPDAIIEEVLSFKAEITSLQMALIMLTAFLIGFIIG